MSIKALILDFDGVILESNEVKMLAYDDLFEKYPDYKDAMRDFHVKNYSQTRVVKFKYYVYELMGRIGDDKAFYQMLRQFSDLVVKRMETCPYVLGAREFLEEFSSILPLYVSSLTPLEELNEIIRIHDIDSYFTGVFGNPPYNKSDAIRVVLAHENLLPSEVIFVGDSASDYHSAVEFGLEFIGRNSGRSFDGIEIELRQDLYEIANVVRPRVKGYKQ